MCLGDTDRFGSAKMARILIIEDELQIRAMLEILLRSVGYEVVLAADGLEGARKLESAPADLVITDLFMPNQDGLETIVQFHKIFPGIPIIAMSGNPAGPTLLSMAHALGTVAVFEKPFDGGEFLKAVEQALAVKSRPSDKKPRN